MSLYSRSQILMWVLFVIGFTVGRIQIPHDFFAAICCGACPVVALLLFRAYRKERSLAEEHCTNYHCAGDCDDPKCAAKGSDGVPEPRNSLEGVRFGGYGPAQRTNDVSTTVGVTTSDGETKPTGAPRGPQDR